MKPFLGDIPRSAWRGKNLLARIGKLPASDLRTEIKLLARTVSARLEDRR